MMLTAVGASVCASGSHVCTGQTGSLTANATKIREKTSHAGASSFTLCIALGSSIMSNVPVEKKIIRIPTSMKALPRNVKIRNFIAEYSRRPLPHIEMRKNIGTISSSQRRKNRMKSSAVNTPMTAVCSTSSHTKYSRTRSLMLQEAKTATKPSRPVRRTSGALRPSTPRKYSTLNESMGIHPGARSTSWTPPFARS